MKSKERPGALLPWKELQQVLAADERFSVEKEEWTGYLLAPKNVSKLAAILYLLREQDIPFQLIGQGTSIQFHSNTSSLLLSLRAFNRCQFLNSEMIEVELGCTLKSLQNFLFEHRVETGFLPSLGNSLKGSVGSALLQGKKAPVMLRGKHPLQDFRSIEFVTLDGGLIKGDFYAKESPHLASPAVFWGMQTCPVVLLKVTLQVHSLPPRRLYLYWSSEDREQIKKKGECLKQWSHSWERLDLVIPTKKEEKMFLIGQISGTQEEMRLFKQHCPFIQEAIEQDQAQVLENYLMQYQYHFIPLDLADKKKANYEWVSLLIDHTWLVIHSSILLKSNPLPSSNHLNKYLSSLNIES